MKTNKYAWVWARSLNVTMFYHQQGT